MKAWPAPQERWIDRMVLLLFAFVVVLGMSTHEIWLDEAQHWCMARDSATLVDLWRNTSGEGHPPMWHWLLWTVTRVSTDVLAMQVLHTLIAIGAAIVMVLKAPLPGWFRWMAPFGYFLAYEYSAIARNYAPGVLLLVVVCMLHDDRRWIWRSLALAGLMLTHLWGLVIASAYIAVRSLFDQRDRPRQRIAQALLTLPFALIALFRVLPTQASPYGIVEDGLFALGRLERTFGQAAMAWWPWPDASLSNPWNSHVIGDHPALLAWCGVLLHVAAFLALPRERRSRTFFALCVIGILLFPWLSGYRGIRYTGPLVLAWIAAQWMAHSTPLLRTQRWLSIFLLSVQAIGGVMMTRIDVERPFGQGSALAHAIAESAHLDLPIVETRYTAGPVISAELDRRLLYPTVGGAGSWCVWSRHPFMPEEEAIRRAPELAGEQAFILLTGRPVDPASFPGRSVEPLVCSTGGMIAHEDGCATLVGPTKR